MRDIQGDYCADRLGSMNPEQPGFKEMQGCFDRYIKAWEARTESDIFSSNAYTDGLAMAIVSALYALHGRHAPSPESLEADMVERWGEKGQHFFWQLQMAVEAPIDHDARLWHCGALMRMALE